MTYEGVIDVATADDFELETSYSGRLGSAGSSRLPPPSQDEDQQRDDREHD
jgi:hypothetical protein